jgi:hypothetical protein
MAAQDRTRLMTASVKPTARELRHFGFLLGTLVIIVFAGIPLLRRHLVLAWPWLIAITLWLPALLAPRMLRYPHRGWAMLGEALGWLNTRIILSLLYFLAVLPIGLVMRLAKRDPMQRKLNPAAPSYRINCRPLRSSHLEQPY